MCITVNSLETLTRPIEKPLKVVFKENLSREELIEEIGKISNPQVMLWYIGVEGLKREGVNFYKKNLSKILKLSNEASCWLYDLTAWGALKNRDIGVTAFNTNAVMINQFKIPRLECIMSSDFFEWLQKEEDLAIVSYLNEVVLQRKFIFKASEDYNPGDIKVGEIFQNTCSMLASILEIDTIKSYSALQYIEGFYLVLRMVESQIDKEEINLVFALPNNENDYYKDEEKSFKKDLTAILKEKFKERLRNKRVNLFFLGFAFGKSAFGKPNNKRPYTAGREILDSIERSQVI